MVVDKDIAEIDDRLYYRDCILLSTGCKYDLVHNAVLVSLAGKEHLVPFGFFYRSP